MHASPSLLLKSSRHPDHKPDPSCLKLQCLYEASADVNQPFRTVKTTPKNITGVKGQDVRKEFKWEVVSALFPFLVLMDTTQ